MLIDHDHSDHSLAPTTKLLLAAQHVPDLEDEMSLTRPSMIVNIAIGNFAYKDRTVGSR